MLDTKFSIGDKVVIHAIVSGVYVDEEGERCKCTVGSPRDYRSMEEVELFARNIDRDNEPLEEDDLK